MTVIDFVVIGVVLLSLAVGAWRGMVSEILALVAWVVAFLAARTWATPAGGWLATGLADPLAEPLTQQVAGFVAIFVAVLILFALARWVVSLLLRAVGLAPLDRVLGSLFGVARGVLVVWVGVLLAGLTALPQQQWWRQAVLAPPLETAVLAAKPWLPPELAKRIRYR
ncbi:MAG: CvpA family protein [Rhodocyclaceae bacterium]|nr:CvpA family protein [Rhodocyclaceae bacterium]MDP2196012.1 CvpA family protein [Rhodocyclaceae bacterium]